MIEVAGFRTLEAESCWGKSSFHGSILTPGQIVCWVIFFLSAVMIANFSSSFFEILSDLNQAVPYHLRRESNALAGYTTGPVVYPANVFDCEVIRYRLLQVRPNLKKRRREVGYHHRGLGTAWFKSDKISKKEEGKLAIITADKKNITQQTIWAGVEMPPRKLLLRQQLNFRLQCPEACNWPDFTPTCNHAKSCFIWITHQS